MFFDAKGRGGSGYVVKKDSLVPEKWFNRNWFHADSKYFGV